MAQAKSQLEEYSELMKKEMAEKEAKYAEMDETVEVASDIFTSEDEDELLRDSDTLYRIRQSAAPKKTGIGYKVFVLKMENSILLWLLILTGLQRPWVYGSMLMLLLLLDRARRDAIK